MVLNLLPSETLIYFPTLFLINIYFECCSLHFFFIQCSFYRRKAIRRDAVRGTPGATFYPNPLERLTCWEDKSSYLFSLHVSVVTN